MCVGGQGEIFFFNVKIGVELKCVVLLFLVGSEICLIVQDQLGSLMVVLGLFNGQVLVFQYIYKVIYLDNKKIIILEIVFFYGEILIGFDLQGCLLEYVSINVGDDSLLLVGFVDK